MGGAEEHRLEDLQSKAQKFGEGGGGPGEFLLAATRVFYSGRGTGVAGAGTEGDPNGAGTGTVLPPAARPWECGSSGPDPLAQLVADRSVDTQSYCRWGLGEVPGVWDV